jgi:predicted RNase H-like HicB family nuclease
MEDNANARQSPSIPPSDKAWHSNHCRTSLCRLGSEDRGIYTETGRVKVSKYTVFFEPTATGYSAYVPDLPGCVAAASTLDETRRLIKEAIEFHIEGMRMSGEAIPEPTSHIEQIDVSA